MVGHVASSTVVQFAIGGATRLGPIHVGDEHQAFFISVLSHSVPELQEGIRNGMLNTLLVTCIYSRR